MLNLPLTDTNSNCDSNRKEAVEKNEEKIRELSTQVEEINDKKRLAEGDMKEVLRNIDTYKVS